MHVANIRQQLNWFYFTVSSYVRVFLVVIIAAAAMFFLPAQTCAQSDSPKHVLIIHGLWEKGVWEERFDHVYREEMRHLWAGAIELHFAYLGVNQNASAEQYEHAAQSLIEEVKSRSVDLIIGVGSDSSHFLAQHLEPHLEGIPSLFVIPDDFLTAEILQRENYALVNSSFQEAVEKTVMRIRLLQPEVRKLVVIGGMSAADQINLRWAEKAFYMRQHSDALAIEPWVGVPKSDLLQRAKALQKDTAILFVSYEMDRNGVFYRQGNVVRELAATAAVPLYAGTDSLIGTGIVGGHLTHVDAYAREAAGFSNVLLRNSENYRLKSRGSAVLDIYDWRQLKRWGLAKEQLPANSRIEYEPHSLWYEFRDAALLGLFILIVQGSLIATLIVVILRNRRAHQKIDQSEQKFRQLYEEFQTLLDAVPDVILLLDSDRKVQWANAAATRTTGSLEALRGKMCYELEPCRETFCVDCVAKVSFESADMWEKTMSTDDGRVWEVRAFPIRNLDGSVRSVLEMRSDISEKQRLRDEAFRSHQLASLGELSAGIAHEVNNPIGLIAWQLPMFKSFFNEVLPRVDNLVTEQGDFLVGEIPYSQLRRELPALIDDMQVGVERVRSILGELKTYAMPVKEQKRECLDLKMVVSRVVALLGKTVLQGSHHLKIDDQEEPMWVHAHFQRLEQVVLNVLVNAHQALPQEGGEVEVGFFTDSEGRNCLRVADNGCGMDAETLKRVTEPFYTTRREQGGSGLGLSICLRIVKEYDGEIVIKSTAGRGSTVDICLPMANDQAR